MPPVPINTYSLKEAYEKWNGQGQELGVGHRAWGLGKN